MRTLLLKKTLLILSLLVLIASSTQTVYGTYYELFNSLFDSLSPEQQEYVIMEKTQNHFTPGHDNNVYEFYRHDSPAPDAPRRPEIWLGQYAAYFDRELADARDRVQSYKSVVEQRIRDTYCGLSVGTALIINLMAWASSFTQKLDIQLYSITQKPEHRYTKFSIYRTNALKGGAYAAGIAAIHAIYQYSLPNNNPKLFFNTLKVFGNYVLLDLMHKYGFDILAKKIPLLTYDDILEKRVPRYNFLKNKVGWLAKAALAAHRSPVCV